MDMEDHDWARSPTSPLFSVETLNALTPRIVGNVSYPTQLWPGLRKYDRRIRNGIEDWSRDGLFTRTFYWEQKYCPWRI